MKNNNKNKETLSPKRVPRLKTQGDIHHFLGRIIRELYRGELAESKASKLGYLCNILLKAIEQADMEARIAALENAIKSASHNNTSVFNFDEMLEDLQSDFSSLKNEVE